MATSYGTRRESTDADADMIALDAWRTLTIKQALERIATAWSEVSSQTVNSAWKIICPKYVHNFNGFGEGLEGVREEIVHLAARAGFEDVDYDSVSEVLASRNEALSNEEMIQLYEEYMQEERSGDDPDGLGADDVDVPASRRHVATHRGKRDKHGTGLQSQNAAGARYRSI